MTIELSSFIQLSVMLIFAGLLIWLTVLSYLFLRMKHHYNQLIKNKSNKNLEELLDEILSQHLKYSRLVTDVKNQLGELKQDGSFHLQHVGFVRFNPFGDTGGEQSFVLALMDQNKNGIVLSSLHARESTRLYAKQLKSGESHEFPLSEEEKKAIATAQALKP